MPVAVVGVDDRSSRRCSSISSSPRTYAELIRGRHNHATPAAAARSAPFRPGVALHLNLRISPFAFNIFLDFKAVFAALKNEIAELKSKTKIQSGLVSDLSAEVGRPHRNEGKAMELASRRCPVSFQRFVSALCYRTPPRRSHIPHRGTKNFSARFQYGEVAAVYGLSAGKRSSAPKFTI